MPGKYIPIKEREALGLPLKRGDVCPVKGSRFYEYQRLADGTIKEVWLSKEAYQRKLNYLYDYGVKRASFNRSFMKRVKLKYGCMNCGYKAHFAALHFDHREPEIKEKNIQKMTACSLKKIKNEMRKCDILCANCHAVRTHKQLISGHFKSAGTGKPKGYKPSSLITRSKNVISNDKKEKT